MLLQHDDASYHVGTEVLAETEKYRLRLCKVEATGQQCMLQVATDTQYNGGLERAVYILRELRQTADLFEAEYAKRGGERPLSYERLFPEVVNSFVATEAAGRRVNILAFAEINDVTQLVPLSNLTTRDHLRVALTSSAWIMGRLLKLLGLAHGEGIAVRALGGSNILIEPRSHYVVVLDWSSALTAQGDLSGAVRKRDIAIAAQSVFRAIGGDLRTGEFPYAVAGQDHRYVEFLWSLASSRQSSAEKAHVQFYELVEELWGREFRPFKTLPL